MCIFSQNRSLNVFRKPHYFADNLPYSHSDGWWDQREVLFAVSPTSFHCSRSLCFSFPSSPPLVNTPLQKIAERGRICTCQRSILNPFQRALEISLSPTCGSRTSTTTTPHHPDLPGACAIEFCSKQLH